MKNQLGLMSLVFIGGSAIGADGIKLGGFVDAQYMWQKAATNSFGVADGAIYLGKSLGAGEVMVDMPFTFVSNSTNATPGVPPGNAILAGFDKAQAWVSWKYDNGLGWKLGQFDTIFRFEGNDSVDNFFASGSIFGAHFAPTSTGLLLSYDVSDTLAVNAVVADPAGAGVMTDGKPDIGFKISSKMDALSASVGGMFMQSDWIFNVIAGTKMDKTAVDLEVTFSSKSDVSGLGFGIYVSDELTETMKLGARFEFDKVSETVTNMALSVGPSFEMSKALTTRIGYVLNMPEGADKGHGVTISAAHRF